MLVLNARELTDLQWATLDALIPVPPRRKDGRGRLHRWQLCSGQKGGTKVGKTKRGKGTKIMAVADRNGLPVAVSIESATPHEVKLADFTLVRMVIPEPPQNLIGDNGYDSDKLDARLRSYGIELISPHRRNRKNRTQDLKTPATVSPTLEN